MLNAAGGGPMKLHPGIRIHNIPVEGVAGFIFAAGSITVLFIGLPEVRLFLPVAAAGGLLIAALLRALR
jgi:hypothetical protein